MRIASCNFPLLLNSSPKLNTGIGFLMLVFCQTYCLLAFSFKKVKKIVVLVMFHVCTYLLRFFAFGLFILSKDYV